MLGGGALGCGWSGGWSHLPSPCTLGGPREDASDEPGREAITRRAHAGIWILGVQPLEPWEVDFGCLSATQPGTFCHSSQRLDHVRHLTVWTRRGIRRWVKSAELLRLIALIG